MPVSPEPPGPARAPVQPADAQARALGQGLLHAARHLGRTCGIEQVEPALFVSRLLAHLCAPVFVLLTGLSAYLYGEKYAGKRDELKKKQDEQKKLAELKRQEEAKKKDSTQEATYILLASIAQACNLHGEAIKSKSRAYSICKSI